MSHASPREQDAERLVANWFRRKGWDVDPGGPTGADLTVRINDDRFEVEVKSLSEGRADRVVPLLSQAILEAQAHARLVKGSTPMAVVCMKHIPTALFNNVLGFARKYAPEVAVGILQADGLGLLKLSGDAEESVIDQRTEIGRTSRSKLVPPTTPQRVNLFSDLNQWMLKVLLAPELPESLLNAPRSKYRTGAEFANAAAVSDMSVSRFLQQLRHDGFLDESPEGYFQLVRRKELFARWRSTTMRLGHEFSMRFRLRASVPQQIAKLVQADGANACLGLFSAADALGLGHVSGVPPYIYVDSLPELGKSRSGWEMVTANVEGTPDFILRQAACSESVFRGAVARDGVLVADVIQTWLDVSIHPSRGQEQADFIMRTALRPLFEVSN